MSLHVIYIDESGVPERHPSRERMAETYGRTPYQFTLFLEQPYKRIPPRN